MPVDAKEVHWRVTKTGYIEYDNGKVEVVKSVAFVDSVEDAEEYIDEMNGGQ